jgi:hypothetical protein
MLNCMNVLDGYFTAVYVFVKLIITYISPHFILRMSVFLNNKRHHPNKFNGTPRVSCESFYRETLYFLKLSLNGFK